MLFSRLRESLLLLDRHQNLITIWFLHNLILDLLWLRLLLLNNDGLHRLSRHLDSLRKLRCLRLLERVSLIDTVIFPLCLLHELINVSFCLPFHSKSRAVNQASPRGRSLSFHFLFDSVFHSSQIVKTLEKLGYLRRVCSYSNSLAVHQFKVVLNYPAAVLLGHVPILPSVILKHVLWRESVIFCYGLLLLSLKVGTQVYIDKAYEFYVLVLMIHSIMNVLWAVTTLGLLQGQYLSVS